MTSVASRTNRSFSFTRNGPRDETDVQRLQHEVDNFTRLLEQEKRRLFTVEEGYQTTTKEYRELLQKMEAKKTGKKVRKIEEGTGEQPYNQMKKQQMVQIHSMEKQLEQVIVKLNQIQAENTHLRRDVDVIRRERVTMSKVRQFMTHDLGRARDKVEEAGRKLRARSAATRNIQDKIVSLKEKNESEQSVYLKEYEGIQRELRQDKKKFTTASKSSKSKGPQDNFDTQTILKRRLQRIILNNKEKVDVIDQYQRNMKMIDEAFNIIKETSGITDIEEIMNTFIKSEEQNYSLFNYVNILTQQIDNFEESNRDLEEEIKQTEIKISEKEAKLAQTPQEDIERKEIEGLIKEKDQYIEDVRKNLQRVRPAVETILKGVKDTEFCPVSNLVIYDDFVFDETTAESYLSILEGATNKMIPYISKIHEVRDFMTTGLLLEEVPDKSFEKSRGSAIPNVKDISMTDESTYDHTRFLDESHIRSYAKESVDRYKQSISFNLGYSPDTSKISDLARKTNKL